MKKYQAGDTLTSVLVSIAVIGFVLAIAYFSLNKSTRQSIDSRELTKVEKAVQGQIEAIKYLSANDHNRHFFTQAEAAMKTSPQTGFCIDTTNQVLTMADLAQPTNTRQCDLGDFPDSAELDFAIEYDKQSPNLFTATASWVPYNSNGKKRELSMYYRSHPTRSLILKSKFGFIFNGKSTKIKINVGGVTAHYIFDTASNYSCSNTYTNWVTASQVPADGVISIPSGANKLCIRSEDGYGGYLYKELDLNAKKPPERPEILLWIPYTIPTPWNYTKTTVYINDTSRSVFDIDKSNLVKSIDKWKQSGREVSVTSSSSGLFNMPNQSVEDCKSNTGWSDFDRFSNTSWYMTFNHNIYGTYNRSNKQIKQERRCLKMEKKDGSWLYGAFNSWQLFDYHSTDGYSFTIIPTRGDLYGSGVTWYQASVANFDDCKDSSTTYTKVTSTDWNDNLLISVPNTTTNRYICVKIDHTRRLRYLTGNNHSDENKNCTAYRLIDRNDYSDNDTFFYSDDVFNQPSYTCI